MSVRRFADRLLIAAVVVLAVLAVLDAVHSHRSAPPRERAVHLAPPLPAALLRCRRVDRDLLTKGRRTSEYLKLPCGRQRA